MSKADIAMIGLGVMGSNLAKNMQSKGFSVAVYDLSAERVEKMAEEGFVPCRTPEELRENLVKPRKVFLMVWAGKPVDDLIEQLIPVLEEGDIIIDGGNSHYPDTIRRTAYVESKGLRFIGCGVSGGEEGALHGPSMMPGGSAEAWPYVKPIFQAICAKVNGDEPCCDWVGENGAGHFVKMVHNGIEYGDMQLICEAYQLMRDGLKMTNDEMSAVFRKWNETELDSYLIQITADILAYRDGQGNAEVDRILDRAGQKGTGKWTGIEALNEAVPLTLITEAVLARCLSAQKDERVEAAELFPREIPEFEGDREAFVEAVRKALFASKIISYTQGYMLMRSAAVSHEWNLNFGGIALMWRGGCIIRSAFLGKIKEAYEKNPELTNLLKDEYFSNVMKTLVSSWREVVAYAVKAGIPMPAMSSALQWFDGYTSERLPANLLQAQRDYFGAHMYERTDAPRGEFFHTDWTGHGGDVASTVYNA